MSATSRFMLNALTLALTSVSLAALGTPSAMAQDPDTALEELLGIAPTASSGNDDTALTIIAPEPATPAPKAAPKADAGALPPRAPRVATPKPAAAPQAPEPPKPTPLPATQNKTPVQTAAKTPLKTTDAAIDTATPANAGMPSIVLHSLAGKPETAPRKTAIIAPIGQPRPLPQLVMEVTGKQPVTPPAPAPQRSAPPRVDAIVPAPAAELAPAMPSETALALGVDMAAPKLALSRLIATPGSGFINAVSAADLLGKPASLPVPPTEQQPAAEKTPPAPAAPIIASPAQPVAPATPAHQPATVPPTDLPVTETAAVQPPVRPEAPQKAVSKAAAKPKTPVVVAVTPPRQLLDTAKPETPAPGTRLDRLTFPAFNSSLQLSLQEQLRRTLLPILQQEPKLQVQIGGYADWTPNGSVEASLAISERRAANVRRFLSEQGIAPNRLQIRGFGVDFLPGAPRDRVDVIVTAP